MATRTLILTGYPNVGKSSFMNIVTNANVDVQEYAFTTKAKGMWGRAQWMGSPPAKGPDLEGEFGRPLACHGAWPWPGHSQ